jgi:hypothetical protein
VVFRVWLIRSPLGLVDGDEAVVGLMARRALHGSFAAFFWGQEYGGAQESLLVAALLAVRVPARWAMELVPVGLHLGAAALVWRIGRRTIDRPGGALLAATLCWAASPALLWWSTKERGFYGVTLVCGLAALLLVLRFCEGPPVLSTGRPSQNGVGVGAGVGVGVGLGLVLGLGWWASPQILHFAVPAVAWLAWSCRRRLGDLVRLLAAAAPAAVVGALPWLWANAHTGLASLEPAADRRVFGDPLPIFFRYGLPMVLGLKAPITLGWQFAGARVAYGLVLLGIVVLLVRRPVGLRPVLLAVAAYPLLFAVLPTTYYYGEPRYLDFLWPLLALLAGWALVRLPMPALAAAVVAVLAVTALGVSRMTELHGPPGEPFEDLSPVPVDDLAAALDRLDVRTAFADYWVAYRLDWETGGRIVASPVDPVRDPRLDAQVRRSPRSAFVAAVRCKGRLQEVLEARAVPFEEHRVAGVWDVVIPARRVLPEELAGSPLC